MDNTTNLVERYIASFNETDADRRRELLDALYTADATYTDPHVEARGVEEIDAFIAGTQDRFPGMKFELGGAVDAHHDQARFQWRAGLEGEADQPFVGFDVIVTESEKIRSVYGFTDAAPGV